MDEEHSATVGGIRLAYRVSGAPDSPPMLLDFDWPVVPAIVSQVNQGDPETWESRHDRRAHADRGGPQSHVPQDLLDDVAARIPSCELVTIPAGYYIPNTHPDQFAATVLRWLTS